MRFQLSNSQHRRAAVREASTPLVYSNVCAPVRPAIVSHGTRKAQQEAKFVQGMQVLGRTVTACAAGKEKASTVDNTKPETEEQVAGLAAIEKEELVEDKGEQLFLYVGGALAIGGVIWGFKGFTAAEEYFAGYLLEQSLSVDNLFVFLLCFNYFKTPLEYQDRVLGWGIWSAALLRLIMILAGVELVENFKPLLLVFAAILFYSSFRILFGNKDEGEEDLSNNVLVKGINKVFTVTPGYRGDRFFVREDGILKATPLFCVLAVIELSDVIFAVDSIPAIFGVTLDPVVVYTSNMAAIVSLRALYGFVASVIAELRYLESAVAVVLGFIGGKMVLDQVPGGYHVSTEVSLAVVVSALSIGVGASLLIPEADEDAA